MKQYGVGGGDSILSAALSSGESCGLAVWIQTLPLPFPAESQEVNQSQIKYIVQQILREGQDWAQTIPTAKMVAHWFVIVNFKGTPSLEEHKTIFSGFIKINLLCLVKLTLWRHVINSVI